MNKDKDKEVYCGECPLFMYEDINGLGLCAAQKGRMHCADLCEFWTDPMGNEEVLRILHYAQKWRRGANTEMLPPSLFGLAITTLCALSVILKRTINKNTSYDNKPDNEAKQSID